MIIILAFLWLVLQLLWYWKHGVRMMGDSEAYISYARSIAQSFYFADTHQLKYVGYPLFLAIVFKLGFGLQAVIAVQMALSGIATFVLFKTTNILAQNRVAPLIATTLFICWYDLQMFNGFILTESLYYSLLIISFYFLVKINSLRSVWVVLPLLLYIATIRPNGFIALVAYSGYVFFTLLANIPGWHIRVLLVLAAAAFLVIVIVLVDQYFLSSFAGMFDTYAKGELIFKYDGYVVLPDQPVVMPPTEASPLTKLLLFMKHNTAYFFKMAILRFLLFWGNIKPFFSFSHNLLIAVVLYPLYIFTSKVLLSSKISLPLRIYVFLLLVQQAFITSLTSEDWNGRFLMSVIAFVFIFGAVGISWQIRKHWNQSIKA